MAEFDEVSGEEVRSLIKEIQNLITSVQTYSGRLDSYARSMRMGQTQDEESEQIEAFDDNTDSIAELTEAVTELNKTLANDTKERKKQIADEQAYEIEHEGLVKRHQAANFKNARSIEYVRDQIEQVIADRSTVGGLANKLTRFMTKGPGALAAPTDIFERLAGRMGTMIPGFDKLLDLVGMFDPEYQAERFERMGEHLLRGIREGFIEGLSEADWERIFLNKEYIEQRNQLVETSQKYKILASRSLEVIIALSFLRNRLVGFATSLGGIDRGRAVAEGLKDVVRSALSRAFSATPVSVRQLREMRIAMMGEFGTLPANIKEITQLTKNLGILPEQYVDVRRALQGTTRDMEEVFQAFRNQGITSQVAAEQLSENADILARAGSNFNDAIVKSIANAKKLGYEFRQVEDFLTQGSLNFSGVVESIANLRSIMPQLSVNFEELMYSQMYGTPEEYANFVKKTLQGSGITDLSKLSRPQVGLLQETFGFSLDELQRILSGEEVESLDIKRNEWLEKIYNIVVKTMTLFSAIAVPFLTFGTFQFFRKFKSLDKLLKAQLGEAGAAITKTSGLYKMGKGAQLELPLFNKGVGAVANEAATGGLISKLFGKFSNIFSRGVVKTQSDSISKFAKATNMFKSLFTRIIPATMIAPLSKLFSGFSKLPSVIMSTFSRISGILVKPMSGIKSGLLRVFTKGSDLITKSLSGLIGFTKSQLKITSAFSKLGSMFTKSISGIGSGMLRVFAKGSDLITKSVSGLIGFTKSQLKITSAFSKLGSIFTRSISGIKTGLLAVFAKGSNLLSGSFIKITSLLSRSQMKFSAILPKMASFFTKSFARVVSGFRNFIGKDFPYIFNKSAGRWMNKVGGGFVGKEAVAKAIPKSGGIFRRIGARLGIGAAGKAVGKGVGKSAIRSGLKKIPWLGALFGLGFAISRLIKGDIVGAALEVVSGGLSMIPGVGTVASLGVDAMLVKRDLDRMGTPEQNELAMQTTTPEMPTYRSTPAQSEQQLAEQSTASEDVKVRLDNLVAQMTEQTRIFKDGLVLDIRNLESGIIRTAQAASRHV